MYKRELLWSCCQVTQKSKSLMQTVTISLIVGFVTSVGDVLLGGWDFLHTMICASTVLFSINLIKKLPSERQCLLSIYLNTECVWPVVFSVSHWCYCKMSTTYRNYKESTSRGSRGGIAILSEYKSCNVYSYSLMEMIFGFE